MNKEPKPAKAALQTFVQVFTNYKPVQKSCESCQHFAPLAECGGVGCTSCGPQ